ncbi:CCG-binding protein [Trifolium repens]|nr:CCG-binding protein [Trifolium repens]
MDLRSLVYDESGIFACSSSIISSADFGNPSGLGQSFCSSDSIFLATFKPFFFTLCVSAIPCKHPIKDFTPPI